MVEILEYPKKNPFTSEGATGSDPIILIHSITSHSVSISGVTIPFPPSVPTTQAPG